jgi:hypothetical protein
MLNRVHWMFLLRTTLIAGLAIQASGQATGPPSGRVDEYQVKAAFLYNFAKFITWPAQTFTSLHDPLTICVMGDTVLRRVLENGIAGKEIEGRRLVVRTISELAQIGGCQILFVSASEQGRVPSILAGCKTRGVLTVGELEGFAAQGGVINFSVEDDKVRFEINLGAANEQQLQISSKLLSLSRIVKTRL